MNSQTFFAGMIFCIHFRFFFLLLSHAWSLLMRMPSQTPTFVTINGVSKSRPPTKRKPHGVCGPSRSNTTENSCSLGPILAAAHNLFTALDGTIVDRTQFTPCVIITESKLKIRRRKMYLSFADSNKTTFPHPPISTKCIYLFCTIHTFPRAVKQFVFAGLSKVGLRYLETNQSINQYVLDARFWFVVYIFFLSLLTQLSRSAELFAYFSKRTEFDFKWVPDLLVLNACRTLNNKLAIRIVLAKG